MDIQPVVSISSVLSYLAKYAAKSEQSSNSNEEILGIFAFGSGDNGHRQTNYSQFADQICGGKG